MQGACNCLFGGHPQRPIDAGGAMTTGDTMGDTGERGRPSPDWEPTEQNYPDGLGSPEWAQELMRLREQCPVAYSDNFGGFYTLTRYSDVCQAALNHQTFRSGQQFLRMADLVTIPGRLNPPEHTAYRRMMNKYFAKDRVDALAPLLVRCAHEHLTPMIERGYGDAATEFCQPLPARGLALALNLGDEAYRELLEHFVEIDAGGWDPESLNKQMVAVFTRHITRLVAQRRAHPLDPEVDLISGAMAMHVDGQPLSDDSVIAIGVSVIGAGHSTTADALSSAIYRLATDANLQARLRSQPQLIPMAVEEFLRLDAPLPELTRRTVQDVRVSGRSIPADTLVALNFGAANLDPEEFADPQACLVERSPNRHLTFGHGVHKCVGAPLARLEMRIALQELLARTRSFKLAGACRPAPGMVMKGFAALPLSFAA
jgi:cytochrome P450